MTTPIQQLSDAGVSIWLDDLSGRAAFNPMFSFRILTLRCAGPRVRRARNPGIPPMSGYALFCVGICWTSIARDCRKVALVQRFGGRMGIVGVISFANLWGQGTWSYKE